MCGKRQGRCGGKPESHTAPFRKIGTSISEAGKRVAIFLNDVRGGKQVSSYFGQELRQGHIRLFGHTCGQPAWAGVGAFAPLERRWNAPMLKLDFNLDLLI